MAFKFVVLAALLACAQAGGPAAYSTYSASGDYHSVGASQETTLKGLGGNNVLSQYSKAVDSPYSSVRISSSRASNDAIAYGAAPALAYGAAPALAYGAGPVLARSAIPSAAGLSYGASGSSVGSSLHGAGAYGVSRLAAPALAYGAAPALAYGAAPALAYGAPALAARAYAPALAAPLAARAYAAPALAAPLAARAYAAPLAAPAHVTFSGLGASYVY